MEIQKTKFDSIFDAKKEKECCKFDVGLTTGHLKSVIAAYKKLVKKEAGRDFPQEPKAQLMEAVIAVFRSCFYIVFIRSRRSFFCSSDRGTPS